MIGRSEQIIVVTETLSNHEKQGSVSQIKSVDICRWLLYSPIQIQEGEHRGGIAGWLDAQNQPQFAYGEIAGYYLSSLSFMAQSNCDAPKINHRMRNAVEWLNVCYKNNPIPATRYYLNSNISKDWRNQVIFSFDLAMIVRGLSKAGSVLGASICADVLAQVCNLLSCLLDDDGCFRSHVALNNAVNIPITWSTQPGLYQVKTAAAILLSQAPANLRCAAKLTLHKESKRLAASCFSSDLHPLFYYLEGLLLLAVHRFDEKVWATITDVYSVVMEYQADNGSLPASLSNRSVASRSDVIA